MTFSSSPPEAVPAPFRSTSQDGPAAEAPRPSPRRFCRLVAEARAPLNKPFWRPRRKRAGCPCFVRVLRPPSRVSDRAHPPPMGLRCLKRLGRPPGVYDPVALEHGLRLVAGDTHGRAVVHAGVDEIPGSRAAEVVKELFRQPRLAAGRPPRPGDVLERPSAAVKNVLGEPHGPAGRAALPG